jgi:RNA polymerase primary sigma factor
MKVSRAKERALMREFGLDETTLTEEEAAKRRQELKTLIKMGKTRGFLTHQEINDHLPEKLVNEEILEAIISMLNDMGIAVYEQAPDAATLLISGSNTTTATDEEAEEAAEAALSTVDSEFGRTTDPVRMYMREMGTVELLTREGEIEIAKRIEGGLQAMMLAISASPTTIAEILSYADKIAAGEMQISEAVDGFVRRRGRRLRGRRRLRRVRRGRRRRRPGRQQGADQEARRAEEAGAGEVPDPAWALRQDAQGLREGRLQVAAPTTRPSTPSAKT